MLLVRAFSGNKNQSKPTPARRRNTNSCDVRAEHVAAVPAVVLSLHKVELYAALVAPDMKL